MARSGRPTNSSLIETSTAGQPVGLRVGHPFHFLNLTVPSVVGFRFVVTPRVAWVTGIHGPTRRHVGRIRVPLTVEHHGCRTRTAWPVAPMRTAALIAPDAERGQWAWERALRHPPAGFVRLPDPALGSTYHLYQRTGQDMIDVQVVCRESNAVVGVTLSGTSDVARADTAVHAASVMIQRVQNGRNQNH